MNISFYTTPPPPEAETLLFKEDWVQFMIGQTVKHNKKTYQVNALQWVDDTRKELKAYCEEVPERTGINFDTAEINSKL